VEYYESPTAYIWEYSILAGEDYMKNSIGIVSKTFLHLSMITLATILIVALAAKLVFPYIEFGPLFGKAHDLPSEFFIDMVTLESRMLPLPEEEESTFTYKNISLFLADLLLNVHLDDPKSLLASTISSMEYSQPILLYKGAAEDHNDFPTDDTPIIAEEPYGPFLPEIPEIPETQEPGTQPPAQEKSDPEIFILHSHNRESWLPELPHIKEAYLAQHDKINISLVGERMAQRLRDNGIETLHSKTDYVTKYRKDYPRYNYYAYSRKSILEAYAISPNLRYIFDVHRDSGKRETTTIQHGGVDYAQTYFVVGMENPQWEENHELAKKVHDKLNEKIPGISKGIYGKDKKEGNGVYNQDLSDRLCLVEIGGVENTLEESNRTADILAEVIQEIYMEEKGSQSI
jgi:stage II sporulation protein P